MQAYLKRCLNFVKLCLLINENECPINPLQMVQKKLNEHCDTFNLNASFTGTSEATRR